MVALSDEVEEFWAWYPISTTILSPVSALTLLEMLIAVLLLNNWPTAEVGNSSVERGDATTFVGVEVPTRIPLMLAVSP